MRFTPGGSRTGARFLFTRVTRLAVLATALATAAALFSASVASAAGTLDTSFGSGGKASLPSGAQALGVTVQSNGQTVVAGESGGKVLVDRLSTSGAVTGSYTGPVGYARAVAIQPDGKIVVAGSNGSAMFVERLTTGLAPDSSFGHGGSVTALSGQSAVANGVAVSPDGSIVAAGATSSGTAVAKFSSSGAQQFAEALNLGAGSLARGVAVQSDNKIVLVGSQTPSQITNAVVARLTTAGALDSSFGGHGALTYSYPGSGYTAFNGVALQSNGQIVAAGSAAEGPHMVLLRVNSNGSVAGASSLSAGQNDAVQSYPIGAYGVAIAGGGAIVAAGNYEDSGTEFDQALWAFNSSGSPEGGFGTGGTVLNPTGEFEGCAIAVAPNGSLLTAGDAVTQFPNANPCAAGQSNGGFVTRFTGFGPLPVTPPSTTKLKASVKGLKGSYKRSSVSKSGVRFTTSCNEKCTFKVTLTASGSVARKLHISKKVRQCHKVHGKKKCKTVRRYVTFTVVSFNQRSGVLSKKVTLRNARLRKAVGTFKNVKLSLHVVATSTSTHKTSKVNKTIKVHK
jgi:uncharacterized delta-60 repeat protein